VAEVARLRDKNLTSVIDYAYLNVTNLRDPDNSIPPPNPETHAKLELFLVDDDQNKEVFEVLVSDPALLQRMCVVIMLDFSQPWNFMTELNRWVTFLNQLLSKAGLTISQLDEMKARVEKYYTGFKEPQFDE
jgi:dynein light intermediate chain 1